MEFTRANNELDLGQDVRLNAPVAELFLDSSRTTELWPEEIANSPSFLQQIELHKELNEHLDQILDSIPQPTITLEAATKSGHITESQVEKLYSYLSGLLT